MPDEYTDCSLGQTHDLALTASSAGGLLCSSAWSRGGSELILNSVRQGIMPGIRVEIKSSCGRRLFEERTNK